MNIHYLVWTTQIGLYLGFQYFNTLAGSDLFLILILLGMAVYRVAGGAGNVYWQLLS